MLKVVSSFIEFYPKVQVLVKEATKENPSARRILDNCVQNVTAVKLKNFSLCSLCDNNKSDFGHDFSAEKIQHKKKQKKRKETSESSCYIVHFHVFLTISGNIN